MTPSTSSASGVSGAFQMQCSRCGIDHAKSVNGFCPCGSSTWHGTGHSVFSGSRMPTMGQAHLDDIETALRKAQECLLGKVSGTVRLDTLKKIEQALSNHVPSVRMRVP